MRPIIDARNPALWQDVPPSTIWRTYQDAMAQAIRAVFSDARVRPIVSVRPEPSAPRSPDRI
jgi:hypothetical protein